MDKDRSNCLGELPLAKAAVKGRMAVVHSLLAGGANVEVQDTDGHNPYDIAAEHGNPDVLKAMLGYNVDVNAAGERGCATLHRAARVGQVGTIDVLIGAGADIELKDSDGRTPRWVSYTV